MRLLNLIINVLATLLALVSTALALIGLVTIVRLYDGYQMVKPEHSVSGSEKCINYCDPE